MFKKVVNDNSIISNKNGKALFYVTKDPHCSSLLKPNKKILDSWYFSHRFKVVKKKISKVITINTLLKKDYLKYIDWLVKSEDGRSPLISTDKLGAWNVFGPTDFLLDLELGSEEVVINGNLTIVQDRNVLRQVILIRGVFHMVLRVVVRICR